MKKLAYFEGFQSHGLYIEPGEKSLENMCEFKVILDEKVVMEDVIYARTEGDTTILQDVIGETSSLNGVKIVEVNVTKARLVLSYISSQF